MQNVNTGQSGVPDSGNHTAISACQPSTVKAAQSSSGPRTLLWIDDYEAGLIVYKAIFEQLGFRVLTAARGRTGLNLAASQSVDAVIVDYEMPEMDGAAVAAVLKNTNPDLPVVMYSGSTFVPARVMHLVDAFCDKAQSYNGLLAAVNRLLQNKHNPSLQPAPPRLASEQGQRTVA